MRALLVLTIALTGVCVLGWTLGYGTARMIDLFEHENPHEYLTED